MLVTEPIDVRGHELVWRCTDTEAGLHALIAVHDRSLGPAVGGCRMWPFADEASALDDVLRLSRGMTLKNALADLPLGGGKSVVIGDPARDKTESLLRAFGRAVDRLAGAYIAAEDVGIGERDVDVMARETKHTAGGSRARGACGDPSPSTARGVFVGIQAAVSKRLGCDDLRGVRVAIQGVGHVGRGVAEHLAEAGARLVVADIVPAAAKRAADELGALVVDVDDVVAADVEVFAPCALGGAIDDAAIERLRAPIVAGAANNQLAEPRHGDVLAARGVLYAPDYAINAGGIIHVAAGLAGERDRAAVLHEVDRIGPRLRAIFEVARRERRSTHRVADALAQCALARQAPASGLHAERDEAERGR